MEKNTRLDGASARSADDHLDALLLRRMAEGDERALGSLYDRWSQRAYAVVARLLDEADAEEVVEQTFWQVWRDAGQFRSERGTVGGWVMVIARSRALERRRSRSRTQRLRQTLVREQSVSTLTSGAPCPEQSAVTNQTRETVLRAIEALPDPQREAVALAFLTGLTHAEIADRTGNPLGTVKTRIRAALTRLRGELAVLKEM